MLSECIVRVTYSNKLDMFMLKVMKCGYNNNNMASLNTICLKNSNNSVVIYSASHKYNLSDFYNNNNKAGNQYECSWTDIRTKENLRRH